MIDGNDYTLITSKLILSTYYKWFHINIIIRFSKNSFYYFNQFKKTWPMVIFIFYWWYLQSDHKPSGHARIKITRELTSTPQTSEIDISCGTRVSMYSKWFKCGRKKNVLTRFLDYPLDDKCIAKMFLLSSKFVFIHVVPTGVTRCVVEITTCHYAFCTHLDLYDRVSIIKWQYCHVRYVLLWIFFCLRIFAAVKNDSCL